jgi:hypothetical protein
VERGTALVQNRNATGAIQIFAPGVLKRLVYKREVPAVALLKLTDVAALPWREQPERVFD